MDLCEKLATRVLQLNHTTYKENFKINAKVTVLKMVKILIGALGPYVLFAYREAPHEKTGFSPF